MKLLFSNNIETWFTFRHLSTSTSSKKDMDTCNINGNIIIFQILSAILPTLSKILTNQGTKIEKKVEK